MLTSLTIGQIKFHKYSTLNPVELQHEVMQNYISILPVVFAFFLQFLCYYHIGDVKSCMDSLRQLEMVVTEKYHVGSGYADVLMSMHCVGNIPTFTSSINIARSIYKVRRYHKVCSEAVNSLKDRQCNG